MNLTYKSKLEKIKKKQVEHMSTASADNSSVQVQQKTKQKCVSTVQCKKNSSDLLLPPENNSRRLRNRESTEQLGFYPTQKN